jgi:hypothetical protein
VAEIGGGVDAAAIDALLESFERMIEMLEADLPTQREAAIGLLRALLTI